jgi:hypothetical protein
LTIWGGLNTPVALSQNITLDEDSTKAIKLIATDGDGDTLTYKVVNQPTHGTYKEGVYTPAKNYHGVDSFTFIANDGKFNSDLATVSITVNPVNDIPVVTSQNITLDEDSAKAIKLIATDVDGDTLVSTIITAPLHGTYANGIYRPSANYFGVDKIVYKVNDGTIDSDLATISITVNPVNDVPVALAQNITLDEDANKTIKLSATDIEGDTLTYKVVNQPTHGTYENGVYTPAKDYHGVDSFTFIANDGQDDSDLTKISITVNDTPTVSDKSTCTPLPRTGQITVYTNYDDGHYQKGADVNLRFERDSTHEIVKDNATGLSWQDDSEVRSVWKTWQGAIEYCEALTLGDFTDWRLPEIEELVYITDKGRRYPAIYPVFENISHYPSYWSSTVSIIYNSDTVWFVNFDYGSNNGSMFKTSEIYVRCVRGGA